MLKKPWIMQRLKALSIDELQASALVFAEALAVMVCSSCWASLSDRACCCAIGGAGCVSNMQVAAMSAAQAAPIVGSSLSDPYYLILPAPACDATLHPGRARS
jgi:hypothetical protein